MASSSKRNDWGQSQHDRAQLTDMAAVNFVQTVRDDILPELALWLEWYAVIKELNLRNQSPSKEEVLSTIKEKYGLITKGSEDVVQSEQLNAKTVAAHNVYLISLHLQEIESCKESHPKAEEMYSLSWSLLRFIQKNLGERRCLSGDKSKKAQAAREKFVTDLELDLRAFLLPMRDDSKQPLPTTSLNTRDLKVFLHWQPSLPTVDSTELETTNKRSFDDLKLWVAREFQFDGAGEKLLAVLVGLSAEDDDAIPVDNQRTLTDAISSLQTTSPTLTSFHVLLVTEKKPEDLGRSKYFGGLCFAQLSELSTDTSGEDNAFNLKHVRSREDVSLLISLVMGQIDTNIVVNRTKASRATAADLNYESTNPFEETDADYGTAISHAYEAVQTWLTTPKADFQNVTVALRELEHLLGTDVEILTKLPKRLKLGPKHRPRDGDRHKPHQICGLFFTLWMEYTLGVFILADGCGVGKTHALMSHVVAAEKMWAKKGEPVTRPTLVLCPRTLLSKTFEDLQDQLGAEWRVAKYGEKLTSTGERIVFDPRHPVYNFKNAGKTIVVCSISQLQNCTLSEESNRARNGLFARILIDEAQCIRRCDQTKQGAILKSFDADYRGLFTGSPVVDTLGDLDGYLAFLEKPEWSDDVDLNVAFDDEARSSRYTRFLAKQDGVRLQAGEEEAELEGWASDCDSINGLDDDQIQAKLEFGWRCGHWPALLKYNADRPPSLNRKTRRTRKNLQASQPMVDPPFEQNPFDLYHPDNRSSIKCCTTKAFRYYIVPHLKPGRVEEDRELIARRVRLILDRLVLGRSLYSETIDEQGNKVKVDADLPPVSIETQELRLSMDEAAAYQMRESNCGSVLLSELTPEMLKEIEDDPKKGNGSTFAKLSTLCTHIGLSGLQKVSTAVFRARRAEGLPVLVARMKQAGSLNPADKDIPLDSPEEVLRQFLWGSPKFRFAVQEVQRVILGSERPETHRKLLVFFQFPRSAEIFLKMMEYVGIRCVLLDMAMSADDRLKNIRAFDSLDDPLILISTYPLNIAGHDLQHRCANVLHVEPAFNWATEYQAQSRVFRIGQTVPVEIVRLFTEGAYQELHEYAMLQKANSMFTAFKALKEAVPHGIAASATTTREELAMSAFGICRRRVKELVDRAAAKKEAKARADAAATGDVV